MGIEAADGALEGVPVGDVASSFVVWLREQLAGTDESVFVGLDGRSGVGKSTLAAAVAARLAAAGVGVVLVEGDQFYAGGSPRPGISGAPKTTPPTSWTGGASVRRSPHYGATVSRGGTRSTGKRQIGIANAARLGNRRIQCRWRS